VLWGATNVLKVQEMKVVRLATLKFLALLFLLPGLAGLILSAMISTQYLETMPKWPAPAEQRIVPREIHGTTVYQTAEEDRYLSAVEYTSVGIFLVGLVVGVIYLERWGRVQSRLSEEESDLAQDI
jgi:hypothetical protein